MYSSGQKILERNRYQFPSSWLDIDNISGEWGAFNEILKRKDVAMQSQVGTNWDILGIKKNNVHACIIYE